MIRIKGLSITIYNWLRSEGFPDCTPRILDGVSKTYTIDLPQYAIIKFRNNMSCDIDIKGQKFPLDIMDFDTIELS